MLPDPNLGQNADAAFDFHLQRFSTEHIFLQDNHLYQDYRCASHKQKEEFQMSTQFLFPSYYLDALHLYASAVMSLRQNGFQLNNIKGKDVIGKIWNRPYNETPGKW